MELMTWDVLKSILEGLGGLLTDGSDGTWKAVHIYLHIAAQRCIDSHYRMLINKSHKELCKGLDTDIERWVLFRYSHNERPHTYLTMNACLRNEKDIGIRYVSSPSHAPHGRWASVWPGNVWFPRRKHSRRTVQDKDRTTRNITAQNIFTTPFHSLVDSFLLDTVACKSGLPLGCLCTSFDRPNSRSR